MVKHAKTAGHAVNHREQCECSANASTRLMSVVVTIVGHMGSKHKNVELLYAIHVRVASSRFYMTCGLFLLHSGCNCIASQMPAGLTNYCTAIVDCIQLGPHLLSNRSWLAFTIALDVRLAAQELYAAKLHEYQPAVFAADNYA